MAGQSLRQQLDEAFRAISVLRAENEALRADNAGLRDRVAHLEAEAAKDSSMSSKPPSTDPIGPRQKRAERRAAEREERKEKRLQGKQPGAPGATLGRRDPDVTVEYRPVACRCCGEALTDAQVVGEVVRQVIDLPPVTPVVTDHVAYRCRCECGAETVAEFPPPARAPVCWGVEVRAFAVYLMDRQHLPVERTAELLADALGAPVSTGWLCKLQAEAAGRLSPFLWALKDQLRRAPVVHTDETGTRVRTAKHWVHTVTTGCLTLLAVHPKRGIEAVRDIGVLGGYAGTIVHDGWAPYDLLDTATHAQCGAHLLRHADDVAQTEAHQLWASQIAGVLIAARDANAAAGEAGLAAVDPKIAAEIRGRYHATLDVAFALLPEGTPPPRRHRGGWSHAQRKLFNLATRMRTGADDVLRLLDDTRVPFTNNAAERALRMVKIHDKISGTFHSEAGAKHFTAVRSYLQTADAHGQNLIGVLRQLFDTGPWLPPAAASP